MIPFIYDALPARIVFGSGRVGQIPPGLQRLGCNRTIVVSTPEQAPDSGWSACRCTMSCATCSEAASDCRIPDTRRHPAARGCLQ